MVNVALFSHLMPRHYFMKLKKIVKIVMYVAWVLLFFKSICKCLFVYQVNMIFFLNSTHISKFLLISRQSHQVFAALSSEPDSRVSENVMAGVIRPTAGSFLDSRSSLTSGLPSALDVRRKANKSRVRIREYHQSFFFF